MEYEKLFEKALNGRSINQAAKDWGIPQVTLNTYAKGKRVPDYQTAMILAREAQVDPGIVMAIMAVQEAKKKPRSLFPEMGFATAALILSVNLFLTPPVEAAPAHAFRASFDNNINYTKFMNLIKTVFAKWSPHAKSR